MKCPTCKKWAKVLETRTRKDGACYRRYECGALHKFSTKETILGPSSTPTETAAVLSTLPRVSPNMPKLKNLGTL